MNAPRFLSWWVRDTPGAAKEPFSERPPPLHVEPAVRQWSPPTVTFRRTPVATDTGIVVVTRSDVRAVVADVIFSNVSPPVVDALLLPYPGIGRTDSAVDMSVPNTSS